MSIIGELYKAYQDGDVEKVEEICAVHWAALPIVWRLMEARGGAGADNSEESSDIAVDDQERRS